MATTKENEFKHETNTENGLSCELPNNTKPKTSRKCGYSHACIPYFNKVQKNFGVTEETIDQDKSIMLLARKLEETSLKLNGFDKKEKAYNFGFEASDFDRHADLNEITAKADTEDENLNKDLMLWIHNKRSVEKNKPSYDTLRVILKENGWTTAEIDAHFKAIGDNKHNIPKVKTIPKD